MKRMIIMLIAMQSIAICPAQYGNWNIIAERIWRSTESGNWIEHGICYDGLGRKRLEIARNASDQNKNIAYRTDYDIHGREVRHWLPTPIDNEPTNEAIEAASQAFYKDKRGFTETIYEASPLSRPIMVFGPGEAWHEAEKSTQTKYELNGNNEVIHFHVEGDRLEYIGMYTTAELKKNILTDEDGHISEEFVDKQGRRILKRRKLDTGTNADTYYIYDGYGNLRYVLPPELSAKSEKSKKAPTATDISRYAYVYEYDGGGRCTSKKLPGCEPILIQYDCGGKPILTQDGNMKKDGLWLLQIYDRFGRTTATALVPLSETTAFTKAIVRSEYVGENGLLGGYRIIDALTGNALALPTETQPLSVFYYDNHNFLERLPAYTQAAYSRQPRTDYGTARNDETGLLTGTYTWLTGSNKSLLSVYYHDSDGNIVESHSANHLDGNDDEYSLYSLTGKLLKRLHRHTIAGQAAIEEVYDYTYDCVDRLLSVSHRLANEETVILQESEYDEAGRLSAVTDGNIRTEYERNARGWLTLQKNSLYEEKLHYYTGEGEPSYNGNISSATRTTSTYSGSIIFKSGHTETYRYDGLNRLVESVYTPLGGSSIPAYSPDYSTQYAYDLNCNITRLSRKGLIAEIRDSIKYQRYDIVDDLEITYDGNRMKTVTDLADDEEASYGGAFHFENNANETEEYAYDENGNLTADLNRGITDIMYDTNNHPLRIDFSTSTRTSYLYDASGRKLQVRYLESRFPALQDTLKVTNPDSLHIPQPVEPTDYIIPIRPGLIQSTVPNNPNPEINPGIFWRTKYSRDWCNNIVYKDGKLERILTVNGYIELGKDGNWDYRYFLTDRQGNITIVTNAEGQMLEHNEYYPFGMPRSGESIQPYKYAGKELDRTNGLDMYDFEARFLNLSVPSFTSIDPLCEVYHDISPYAYCAGNPILYTDPTGKRITVAGVEYKPDMEYNGDDNFVKNTIDAIQRTYKNGGEEVVNNLVAAENTYNFVENNTRDKSFTTPVDNSNDIEINMRTENVDIKDYYNAVSHELFHGIQYFHGQGGATIFNEVEAYLFASFITQYIQFYGEDFEPSAFFFPTPDPETREEIIFSNAINNLKNKFSEKDMDIAIEYFKKGATQNNSGIYNKYVLRKANQPSSLMPPYFDFNNIK